jgi:Glyoxalase/Bleomycin resistance protein/Dioxygenase superfamily
MIPSGQIFQSAYVVDDLDASIERWRKIGNIGPFFVMRDCSPESLVYRGHKGELIADIAFCQSGAMMIELIQPKSSGPNLYRDTVPPGRDGFHHQGYFSDELEAELARFDAMGVEVATKANFGTLRYAYFDTSHLIGCMTEVLQRDPAIESIFQMIADAAVDWDGSDPVRLI